MEDYDFLIPKSNEASQYSRHDIYRDKYFGCGIEAGYRFNFRNWYIIPSAGFRYYNYKWSASGGYLQYPIVGSWTGTEPKQNLVGTVISYEQAVWFPTGTVEAGCVLGRFIISLTGSIYPYIWAETLDTHFLRSVQFYDSLEAGIGWNTGLSLKLYPGIVKKMYCVFFRIDYESINNVHGYTSSSSIGLSTDSLLIDNGYSSKIETEIWYISLGIILSLGNEFY